MMRIILFFVITDSHLRDRDYVQKCPNPANRLDKRVIFYRLDDIQSAAQFVTSLNILRRVGGC